MGYRRLQLFLLVVLTLGLVWACQGTAVNSGVTLKMSGWGASPSEQRLLQAVLRQFEATHPTIRVRFETIADQYMDVIKTRLIGDAAPDVFYLEAAEAPFLLDKNVLEPLDAYITPDFDLADFEPNLLDLFRHQGQLYGLPKDYSTLALFYNQQAFADAGIQQPPSTWDELITLAKQLTIDRNQDGRIDQYGFGVMAELPRLGYVIRAYGGEMVNANGYAAYGSEAAAQGLAQIVNPYRSQGSFVQPADVGSSSGSEQFGQGKAAMVIEGNWAIPFLQDTFPDLAFATSEVPTLNQQPGTMVYTVAYVMNRQSQHKAEAWQLIAYLTGKQGMKDWTSSGFALPTRKSVAAQLQYDRDPLRSALVAGVSYATPWQIGSYPSAVMNSFNNQFLSAMLGQQPLQQALEQAQREANAQIQAAEAS
ncbi:ABC transporter substrate-binding protein [Leptolyngbya sp. NK1-12]|uniref:ABC transporter substrate-binding protein n=1 Tax=Leptolyngbya sp. NK1-12 TaxID=2547451 RepID=A0AA97AIF6_9CYAN|nr:ABC transporter substrate-binding protein [Leptolyngbya sp. NK1-12]WNZ21812.1 ABC transporter substrate-binding protein [Leptolyngbya sp. NK1-12]